MFAYRHRILARDIAMQQRAAAPPSTIAVAGSSGLIGSALRPLLTTAGHTVKRLVRREPAGPDEIRWSPDDGQLDAAALRGVNAVVNLAGESIVGRWTEKKKQRITSSRVNTTRVLAETLAAMDEGPRVLVNASAVGCYGDRGNEVLDERSALGEGFLAESCRAWEAATQPAEAAGVRTVKLRTGLVLSPKGGALANMLPLFRLGVAGRLGDGSQWWSWIAIDDVVGAIHHALFNEHVEGPVNLTAPNPVTNAEFTKTLGRVLHRPTILPAPRIALRLAFGEMADDAMFSSARVLPRRLLDTGYAFSEPDLEPALRHLLGREEK